MPDFPPQMTLCVGTVVLRDDEVLLVRQTYGADLKGKWSLPWGFVQGRGDDGEPEPPHVAGVRETLEEAGITAEIEGLLGIQNHVSSDGDPRVYFLFLCRHISGEPTPDGYETDGAAYFSLAELDQSTDPIDPFCDWLARKVLQNDYHLIPPQAANPYPPHLAFL